MPSKAKSYVWQCEHDKRVDEWMQFPGNAKWQFNVAPKNPEELIQHCMGIGVWIERGKYMEMYIDPGIIVNLQEIVYVAIVLCNSNQYHGMNSWLPSSMLQFIAHMQRRLYNSCLAHALFHSNRKNVIHPDRGIVRQCDGEYKSNERIKTDKVIIAHYFCFCMEIAYKINNGLW